MPRRKSRSRRRSRRRTRSRRKQTPVQPRSAEDVRRIAFLRRRNVEQHIQIQQLQNSVQVLQKELQLQTEKAAYVGLAMKEIKILENKINFLEEENRVLRANMEPASPLSEWSE